MPPFLLSPFHFSSAYAISLWSILKVKFIPYFNMINPKLAYIN